MKKKKHLTLLFSGLVWSNHCKRSTQDTCWLELKTVWWKICTKFSFLKTNGYIFLYWCLSSEKGADWNEITLIQTLWYRTRTFGYSCYFLKRTTFPNLTIKYLEVKFLLSSKITSPASSVCIILWLPTSHWKTVHPSPVPLNSKLLRAMMYSSQPDPTAYGSYTTQATGVSNT